MLKIQIFFKLAKIFFAYAKEQSKRRRKMAVIESLIDHKTNLTIHTVNGLVDGDDIIQRMEEYHSGEVTKLIIWDFSDADLRDLTTKKIKSITNIGRHFTKSRMSGQKALIS